MIQLLLNNKSVDIPTGIQINYIIENPFFTNASDYTQEIELYPKTRRNASVFGSVFRHETNKKQIMMDCSLVVNNKVFLKGKATTTEFNDKSVKVQLLGNNSAVNFEAKFDDIFIDEMPLKRWPFATWADITVNDKVNGTIVNYESLAHKIMAEPEECDFVMLPAENEEGEEINPLCIYFPGAAMSNPVYGEVMPEHGYGYPYFGDPPRNYPELPVRKYHKYAIQPRLTAIVREVVKGIGYEVTEFDAENTDLKYLYYVNVKDTFSLNEMLPHWTLAEFLSQIQYYLGSLFIFDSINKTCKIKFRNNYKDKDICYLDKVSDEFTVDFNDETDNEKYAKKSNLLYETSEYEIKDLFDETANENARFMEFFNRDQMAGFLSLNKNFVGKLNGRNYVVRIKNDNEDEEDEDDPNLLYNTPIEVNYLGCDYNKNFENISLKIVPAVIKREPIIPWGYKSRYYAINYDLDRPEDYKNLCWAKAVGAESTLNRKFNIYNYIFKNEKEEENSLDLMRVACFRSWDQIKSMEQSIEYADANSQSYVETKARIKHPRPFVCYPFNDYPDLDDNYNYNPILSLRNIKGYNSVYSLGVDKSEDIDTKKAHQFYFYDDIGNIDIEKIFVIRGVKYKCYKIELVIDMNGIMKKKKGTFYRLKD